MPIVLSRIIDLLPFDSSNQLKCGLGPLQEGTSVVLIECECIAGDHSEVVGHDLA